MTIFTGEEQGVQVDNAHLLVEKLACVLQAAANGESVEPVAWDDSAQAGKLAEAANSLLLQIHAWNHERASLARKAHFLEQVNFLLTSNLGSRDLAEILAMHAGKALNAATGLLMYDRKSPKFHVYALYHDDPDRAAVLKSIWGKYPGTADEGFVGQVISTGKPVLVKDARNFHRFYPDRPEYKELGIRSLLFVPAISSDILRGILVAGTDADGRELDEQDVELAANLAKHIAVVLEKSRLYEEQTRLVQESQGLNSISRSALSSFPSCKERFEVVASSLAQAAGAGRCFILRLADGESKPVAAFGLSKAEQRLLERAEPAPEDAILRRTRYEPQLIEASAVQRCLSGLTDRLAIRDALTVPIVCGEEVSYVALLERPADREFSEDARRLCKTVAGLASVVIERSRQFEIEHNMAEALRKTLVPDKLPDIPHFEIGLAYEPADSTSGMAGDFYDFIELPDGSWAIVIADVCGKGLKAASVIAMGKYLIRAYAIEDPSPASVLNRTNHSFACQPDSSFFTAMYAIYDPESRRITLANAGHPAMLHCVGPRGICMFYGTSGPPLGVVQDAGYTNVELSAESGDLLVMVTDGIVEARANGELFDFARIDRIVHKERTRPVQELADHLAAEAKTFSGGRLEDDIAVIVARII